MVLVGLGVLITGLEFSDSVALYTLGVALDTVILAFFVHLVLAFPSGRVAGRAARIVVGAVYVAGALQVPTTMFTSDQCAACPDNVLLIAPSDAVTNVLGTLQALIVVVGVIAAVVILVRRWRASRGIQRRGLEPVLGVGATILVLAILQAAARSGDLPIAGAVQTAFFAAFALLPLAFLAGLLRTRFFRVATVSRLIERLSLDPGGLSEALRSALNDPGLTVAYWLPELDAYVERDGRVPDTAGRVTTEIRHRGRKVGALVHAPAVSEAPELLDEAVAAAALAIENGRLEVELRARLEALRASRARIVEAGDAERRRLTRDLHDGAQQRLVSLMIELKLARDRFNADPELSLRLVDSALVNAGAAVEELRDLAAGIHPAVLSQRGLDAGLETLAIRASLPVELACELPDRLPLPVETAAYFVAAEALTNVAKYAQATHAAVAARVENGSAVIEVRDDGVGGADPATGSGLRGLADRVGALDGTLHVVSPPEGGTLVRARIPLTAQKREHG
jgi:signal transduction histidine kinase